MTPPTDRQGVAGPGDSYPAAAKRGLREQALQRRDAMAGAQRLACGEALRARLVALPAVADAATILCFASFRSEIDTMPLIDWCLEHGIAVALPRIIGPRHMEACAVTDPRNDLIPGHHDIPEPREGLALVDPAVIDVVIVPGSAFDREGGRMGYGGGFYDAFLLRLRPDARRIGIGFEAQLVERVPREEHDLCVDLVVTESRAIETACRPAGAVR
jgi:5-formyltetrahydrofolate cyclo-ligase